jgi:ubiquitin-conjugating enzyme E2 variant
VAFEIATVPVFVALLAGHADRTLDAVNGPHGLAIVLIAAIAAVLFTDLASGVVHWWCDTFFDERTPVIGPAVIFPFREHHRDPLAITRRGFFQVNHSNCLVMLPLLAAAWWWAWPSSDAPVAIFGAAFLLVLAPAVSMTNQIHQWAHAPAVPRAVRWAQGRHLLLDPRRHEHHHTPEAAAAYCITTGWLNPLVDRLGILPAIERALRPSARS